MVSTVERQHKAPTYVALVDNLTVAIPTTSITVTLTDGARLTGTLEVDNVQFEGPYGSFHVELNEIAGFSDGLLERVDGTRLPGAFVDGYWRIFTDRGDFDLTSTQIAGVENHNITGGDLGSVSAAGDVPTEEEARRAFQELLDGRFGAGIVQVTRFQKTDGLRSETFGVAGYELEFAATLLYPQGIYPECNPNRPGTWPLACLTVLPGSEAAMSRTGLKGHGYREVGEIEEATGSIVFERSKRGWRRR